MLLSSRSVGMQYQSIFSSWNTNESRFISVVGTAHIQTHPESNTKRIFTDWILFIFQFSLFLFLPAYTLRSIFASIISEHVRNQCSIYLYVYSHPLFCNCSFRSFVRFDNSLVCLWINHAPSLHTLHVSTLWHKTKKNMSHQTPSHHLKWRESARKSVATWECCRMRRVQLIDCNMNNRDR